MYKNKYKVIDLEHHCETELFIKEENNIGFKQPNKAWQGNPDLVPIHPPSAFIEGKLVDDLLLDLSDYRISIMDKAGIDFAQLSLTTPGSHMFGKEEQNNVAKDSNDRLAEFIKTNPTRFGAYMALSVQDIEWTLDEIDRCAEMGLWGWQTLSNFNGSYLDEKKYWPILEKFEKKGMPIYIHPAVPNLPSLNEFGLCLTTPALGFTIDTLTCLLRMIHRGVFDAFPNLKIMFGHLGEGIGFLKDRINSAYRQGYGKPSREVGDYTHEPSYYVDHNVYATSCGNLLPAALHCTVDSLGVKKLSFSSDYPFEDIMLTVPFIADDPKLTEEEKEAILYKNAQELGFGKNI